RRASLADLSLWERWSVRLARRIPTEGAHDRGLPLGLRAGAGAARAAQPAGAVVAVAAHSAAPAPAAARPGEAAARHSAEGRDAGAHAVVAALAAPHPRRAADRRGGRPVVESAARDLAGFRSARTADRRRLGRRRHLG